MAKVRPKEDVDRAKQKVQDQIDAEKVQTKLDEIIDRTMGEQPVQHSQHSGGPTDSGYRPCVAASGMGPGATRQSLGPARPRLTCAPDYDDGRGGGACECTPL